MSLTNLRLWLQGRKTVTLPELQYGYAKTYSNAKKVLKTAIDQYWVDPQPQGLHFRVNDRNLSRGKPNPAELSAMRKALTFADLNWMRAVLRQKKGYEPLEMRTPGMERRMETLSRVGLVHEFCGKYFLSVDDATLTDLVEGNVEVPEDPVVRAIGYSILCNAMRTGLDPEPVLKLGFVPEECRIFVRREYPRLRVRGICPKPLGKEDELSDGKSLRFEMIEAFIRTYRYETKEEYDRQAEADLETILSSPLCSEMVKNAAKDAAREIIHDLTLSNIKEIYHIISS